MYGIDVDGDFPFAPVQAYAEAHGQAGLLAQNSSAVEAMVRTTAELLEHKGISPALRYLNDPERIRQEQDSYRRFLLIGSGAEQPGPDLLAAWYRRNFLICANIVQNSRPGDRVVVIYGSGHAFLLRQCITEMPGFQLVEPNTLLPQ